MSYVYNMDQFLARSTDIPPDRTELYQTVAKLPPVSPDGPWIAGGAIRRTLQADKLESDIDYFFRDEGQLKGFSERIVSQGFSKLRETDHHIHYRGKLPGEDKERDVQAIKMAFYRDAASVIDSFDFTICMFAFDGTQLTSGEHSLWDLGRKRLAVHKITYPTASVRRMLKYGRQGFTVCNGAITELLRQTASSPEAMARLNIFYID